MLHTSEQESKLLEYFGVHVFLQHTEQFTEALAVESREATLLRYQLSRSQPADPRLGSTGMDQEILSSTTL